MAGRATFAVILLASAAAAGCARFPAVDAAEARLVAGPAPVLLPTEDLEARTAPPRAGAATEAALLARAAALRARAAALRAR
jgi:hypothetical protein